MLLWTALCLVPAGALQAGSRGPGLSPAHPGPGIAPGEAEADSLVEPAPPDSADAAVADTLVSGQWSTWRDGWLAGAVGPTVDPAPIDRRELALTSAQLFSELLERATPLGLHSAGSPVAWDLPYRIGPGVERLSLWLDGRPTTGAAIGEAHTHTVSPLLLERVRVLAPDPCLDPLAEAGDGMIWTDLHVPDWEEVPSAVRLTEGVGKTSTEDVLYARAIRSWRTLASYAHAHTEGRQLHPSGLQRYREGRFQNLLLRIDGALPVGAPRLIAAERVGRATLSDNRKLLWECGEVGAGFQTAQEGLGIAQVRVTRRNDRLHWWGSDDSGRRRTRSTTLVAQAASPRGPWTLLASGAAERVDLRLTTVAAGDSAWHANGTGLAMGLRWEDSARSAVATAGWSDPWWTDGHLRAHLRLEQRLGGWLGTMHAEGWSGRATLFVPRLEPDGDALVREGLHLGESARRVRHIELGWRPGGPGAVGGAFFARRIEDGLGLDPATAGDLRPEDRSEGTLRGCLGSVTLTGAQADLRLPLFWGTRVEGAGTVLLDPAPAELPVLVAPYRGRVGGVLEGRLFQGDLAYRLGLTVLAQGEIDTPYGPVPARARLDGEIHVLFLDRAHLFLQFQNLTDEFFESATYDGDWGALPYRSSTLGLEWHFSD